MSAPADLLPKSLRATASAAGFYLALAAVGLTCVGLLMLSANPLVALVPVGGFGSAFLLARLPLRWSCNILLLGMLALDESQDAGGSWVSPLAWLGDVLHYRIDATLPLPGFSLSGMEVTLLALFAVRAYRSANGDRIDEAGRVEPASVIRDLIILYLAGVLYAEVLGLARGWGAVPYKLRNLLHPLMLAVLFAAAYRGPRDALAVGRIIVFAACVKGVLAHVVQQIARAETGGMYRNAISHGDSMIFAAAFFFVILRFLERPQKRYLVPGIIVLGFVTLGCIENNRRIAWVIIALSCVAAYAIRPLAGWQRHVTRLILVAIPIGLLYVGVGWNSGSRLFFPVQILRGVADTSHDTSAYWREVETWNIAVSMRGSAVMGMGLGGEYTEHMFNDAISYVEYREWPHNTVMGLLMLMGLFGFTAHWVLLPAVLFLSARSYWMAHSSDDRLLALSCISAVISCLVMAWGDTGAHFPQFKIFAALAIAFSAKLAVSTGAWPRSRPL